MALTNLCILKYNNYFNRIIKRPTPSTGTRDNDVADYQVQSPTYYEEHKGINFYKADNISTKLILNTYKTGVDYLVEYNSEDVVISRWFIIENKQTRAGQTELTLYRDVIADNYDDIINADCYVEKATVQSVDDVAIFNQEDIDFNIIKQKEELIKGKSGTAWIVGYMEKPTTTTTINITSPTFNTVASYNSVEDFYDAINYDPINHIQARPEISVPVVTVTASFTGHLREYKHNVIKVMCGKVIAGGSNSIIELDNLPFSWELVPDNDTARQLKINALQSVLDNNLSTIQNKAWQLLPNFQNSIFNLNNKYVTINGVNKRITVNRSLSYHIEEYQGSNDTTTFGGYITSLFTSTGGTYSSSVLSAKPIKANIVYYDETIVLEDAPGAGVNYSFDFKATNRKCSDAPYTMFCIPYDPVGITNSSYVLQFITMNDRNTNLNIASEIAKQLGSKLYDIQLLPYCPYEEEFYQDQDSEPYYAFTLNNLVLDEDYTFIKDNNSQNKQIILFPKHSNMTSSVGSKQGLFLSSDVIDNKIANQCDTLRLCSPNMASQFEFNLCKTGSINGFDISVTFKPYSPFIHITPIWGRLYKKNFNDYRGLICQGDFSLPILNDAWQQYQISNKNYLNAFNRQIDSIELKNKYAIGQDILNAVGGTGAGAVAGAIKGGVYGAVAGGIVAGGLGVADVALNENLRRDNLDLTKDMFNYSLQNIKALPDTITKISSYDGNNKLFPILEFYSCTEQEKEIFRNKMKYNGMKIMRIDKIANFLTTKESFIQARLVRSEDLSDDTHLFNVIDKELSQGIYIGVL